MAQEAFPLHLLVWNNQYLELDRELQKSEVHFNPSVSYLKSSLSIEMGLITFLDNDINTLIKPSKLVS